VRPGRVAGTSEGKGQMETLGTAGRVTVRRTGARVATFNQSHDYYVQLRENKLAIQQNSLFNSVHIFYRFSWKWVRTQLHRGRS